jgi:hypothetical protein
MPVELVWLGGVLVVVFGVLIFVLIRRQKPPEPPHFRQLAPPRSRPGRFACLRQDLIIFRPSQTVRDGASRHRHPCPPDTPKR